MKPKKIDYLPTTDSILGVPSPIRTRVTLLEDATLYPIVGGLLMLGKVSVVSACLFLGACVYIDPVEDALGQPPFNWSKVSCEELEFTRHCDKYKGPTLEIEIEEYTAKVASNEDGSKIVITNSSFGAMFRDVVLDNPFVFNSPKVSKRSNRIYLAVERELNKAGLQAVSAIPIEDMVGDILAYIVEVDGDAFSVLKEHAVSRERESL